MITASRQPTVGPFSSGSRVTYTCNAGYIMEGEGIITCQANGQWTPRPTCVPAGNNFNSVFSILIRF